MKNGIVVFMILGCYVVSSYGITFFNLTSGTLELHVRTQRLADDRAMHAVLQPHTQVTWQAPHAPSMQLTLATQQYSPKNRVLQQPQVTSMVYAHKTPVVPSFSPWQKTTTMTIKPAPYSPRSVLCEGDCVLIRQKGADQFVALTVGKYVGLAALRNYSTKIAMRFKLKKNEIQQ